MHSNIWYRSMRFGTHLMFKKKKMLLPPVLRHNVGNFAIFFFLAVRVTTTFYTLSQLAQRFDSRLGSLALNKHWSFYYRQPDIEEAHVCVQCVHHVHAHTHMHANKRTRGAECVIYISCTDQSSSLCCYQMVRTHHQVLWVPNNALAQRITPTPTPRHTRTNTRVHPGPFCSPQWELALVSHPLIVLQTEAMIQTRITSTGMGGSN